MFHSAGARILDLMGHLEKPWCIKVNPDALHQATIAARGDLKPQGFMEMGYGKRSIYG